MDIYNDDFWKALDELVNNSEIIIDRPKGTSHPKYPKFVYQVDYGYLKDTASMDGAGIDVWVGSGDKKVDAIMCIVDLMKRDSEIKILVGCTEEEKQEVEVPNVVGMDISQAKKELQSLGLEIEVKEKSDSNNNITKQLPKAGIKIKQGTSVIVYQN